ncbi:MAG: hypothetical protein KDG55_20360, partial [Rhodocyclaceae bacterium]|nr:hypothetical protein [Rhodocyclaceae bacterium]
MTQSSKEQQRLIGLYEKLDPTLREVVQVAAVSDPLSRRDLFKLAGEAGVSQEDGLKPQYKNDRDAVDAAIESGILEFVAKPNASPLQAAVLLQDFAFRQAFASGLAERVREQIDGGRQRRRGYALDEDKAVRDMRFAFYADNWDEWQELGLYHSFRPYLLDPFCKRTFAALSPKFQSDFFIRTALGLVHFGDSRRCEFAASVGELVGGMENLPDDVILAATDLLTAQGNIAGLVELAARAESHPEIEGCVAFLRGDFETARKQFEAVDQQRKGTGKRAGKRTANRTTNLRGFPIVLFTLLLLRENSAQSQQHVKQLVKVMDKWATAWHMVSIPLEQALFQQVHPLSGTRMALHNVERMSPLSLLISGWVWSWFFADHEPPISKQACERLIDMYRDSNLAWMAAEFSAIATRMSAGRSKAKGSTTPAEEAHSQLGTVSLVDLIQPAPAWEAGLTALENLAQPAKSAASTPGTPVADERLIWEAEFGKVWVFVTPFIQKHGAKGWSKGRKVGLERLYDQWQTPAFDFLTEQDRTICSALRQYSERDYYGYSETRHEWDQAKLISGLVGHPHVYRTGQRDEPIQVYAGRPQLAIKRSGKQIQLVVEPWHGNEDAELIVSQEGSHRYSIVTFSNQQREVANLVTRIPSVPVEQQDRVFEVARTLASIIDIQSDLEGTPSTGEEVKSSAQIVVQLTPYNDGLRAELFVQPFGEK